MKSKNNKKFIKGILTVITLLVSLASLCVGSFAVVGADGLIPIDPSTSTAPIWPNPNSINIVQSVVPIGAQNGFEITLKVESTLDKKPVDTIVVMDLQHNMQAGAESDAAKLENIKLAIKNLVSNLLKDTSTQNRVCILSVGTIVEAFPFDIKGDTTYGEMYNETYFTDFTSSMSTTEIDEYISKLNAYIDNIDKRLNGTNGTNISAGILKANEIIAQAAPVGPRTDIGTNEYDRSIVIIGDSSPTFNAYPILNMNDPDYVFEKDGEVVKVTMPNLLTNADIIGFDNSKMIGEGKTNTNIMLFTELTGNLYDYDLKYGNIVKFPTAPINAKYKFGTLNNDGNWVQQTIIENSTMKEFAKIAVEKIPTSGPSATSLYTIGYRMVASDEAYWEALTEENEGGIYYNIEKADEVPLVYQKIEGNITNSIKDVKVYYRIGEYFEPTGSLPSNIKYIAAENMLVWTDIGALNKDDFPQISFPIAAKKSAPLLKEIATNKIDSYKPWEESYNENNDSYIQFTNIVEQHEHIQIEPQIVALGCGLITLRGCLINNANHYINENGEESILENSIILTEKYISPFTNSYLLSYDPLLEYTNIVPTIKIKDKFGVNDYPKYIYKEEPSQEKNVIVKKQEPFHILDYNYRIQTAFKVRCYYIDAITGKEIPIPDGEFLYDKNEADNPLYFEDTVTTPAAHQIEGFIFSSAKTGTLPDMQLKPNPDRNVFKYIYDVDPNTYSIKGKVTFDVSTKNFTKDDYGTPSAYLFRKQGGVMTYWRESKGVLRKEGVNYAFDYSFNDLFANEHDVAETNLFSYYVAIKYNNNFIIKKVGATLTDTNYFTAQLPGFATPLNFAQSSDITIQKGETGELMEAQKLSTRDLYINKIGYMTSDIDADFYYTVSNSTSASLNLIPMFKDATNNNPYFSASLGGDVYVAQKFTFKNIADGMFTVDFIDKINFANNNNLTVVDIPINDWKNYNRVKFDGSIIPAAAPINKEDFYVVYKLKNLAPLNPKLIEVPAATIITVNSPDYENLIYFKKATDDTGVITFNWDSKVPLIAASYIYGIDDTKTYSPGEDYDYIHNVIDESDTITIENGLNSGTLKYYKTGTNKEYEVNHQFVISEPSDITLKFAVNDFTNAKVTVALQKLKDKGHYENLTELTSWNYSITDKNDIIIKCNTLQAGNYQVKVSLASIDGSISTTPQASFNYSISIIRNYLSDKYIKKINFNFTESDTYSLILKSDDDLINMNYEIYDITAPLSPIKIGTYEPKTNYNVSLDKSKAYQLAVIYNRADITADISFDLTRTTLIPIGKKFTVSSVKTALRIGVENTNVEFYVKNTDDEILFNTSDNNGYQVINPYLEDGFYYYELNPSNFPAGNYEIITTTPNSILSIQQGTKTINNDIPYFNADRTKFVVNVFGLNNLK